MSELPRVCIIGPSVYNKYMGGVATHIRNLQLLSCFRDAVVIDPGSVHSNHKTNIIRIVKSIAGLRKKMFEAKYTHVLINTSIYPFSFIKLLGILAAISAKNGPEIHVFFHGGRFQSFNTVFVALLKVFSFLLKKVKKFYFLSDVQMEGFQRLFSDYKSRLYANYSTSDKPLCKDNISIDGRLKLLFVGRVVKEKGVFELLSAIDRISAIKENIKLVIVGDGPELADLMTKAEKLSNGVVHFTGHLSGDKLDDEYKKADILILPSYHPEGFPYTVIEAMRAGLPIISTSEGALEMLVQDGVTGFKVQPKSVDSIVMAIRKVLQSGNLLEQMSRNCQRYFCDNLNKSAAERFYANLVGAKCRDMEGRL